MKRSAELDDKFFNQQKLRYIEASFDKAIKPNMWKSFVSFLLVTAVLVYSIALQFFMQLAYLYWVRISID